ncbi:MAG: DUF1016 family protein [Saprospiraceae bacterium]|nr:DUF1016 family protein [Saprospiraceae bacterium]
MQNLETLYQQIRETLDHARHRTYAAVNFAMVESYWEIGRLIVEEEQNGKERADYGQYLISELAVRLTKEVGKGFTETNLKYMRLFYQSFPIRHAVRDELTWTHYRLLTKVENENARQFYLTEAISAHWSTRQLERQINSFYYERMLVSREKQQMRLDENKKELPRQPIDLIKDPYVLEFLGLKDFSNFSEKELEQALIDKLQVFMLELGKGFAFVARQFRISTETKHFYVDLVFYNIPLKCYVLIDLKIAELEHADIGQMDMYVRLFEDKMRGLGDNPTVGIILCTEKDETIVRYSVLKDNEQLFASQYKLYLPTEAELAAEINAVKLEKGLE